jgi:hypothetical protein
MYSKQYPQLSIREYRGGMSIFRDPRSVGYQRIDSMFTSKRQESVPGVLSVLSVSVSVY